MNVFCTNESCVKRRHGLYGAVPCPVAILKTKGAPRMVVAYPATVRTLNKTSPIMARSDVTCCIGTRMRAGFKYQRRPNGS